MKDKKKLKISLNKVKLGIQSLTKKQRILYITSCLVVCIITFIFGMYSNFNKRIDNNKLENKVETKGLSMMLETGRGTGQYEMAIRDKWPTEGYIFNETLSKCENGGTLEWDDVNKTVKVHTSVSDKCYVYFDVEPPDVYIATSNIPTTYGALGNVTCSSNGATYNQKYNRVEISNISNKYENCSLTYTEPTSKTYLNDYIIGLAGTTQGNGQVVNETIDIPDYSTATVITESAYTNQSIFSSTSYSSTSGTSVSGVYSYSDDKWISDASSMTSKKYYHFKFTPSESGYYQMCYEFSNGNSKNQLYAYVNSKKQHFNNERILSASPSTVTTGCAKLGYVSNSDYIKIVQYTYDDISTLSFNIEKVNVVNTSNDFRFEGKNPNNYVWYNNELWRIIGVFDSNSHGQSKQNLVKIIREKSIGGLVYDKSGINNWEISSINSLLNSSYLNANDGTDSGYCYMYSDSVQANCDYRISGIQDGYKNMIQNVTWYLGGAVDAGYTTEEFYRYERGTAIYSGNPASVMGYIGLIYPSDYGYSVLSSSCPRTTNLKSYSSSSCGDESWIIENGEKWMITPNSLYPKKAFYLNSDNFNLVVTTIQSGILTFPVLYLKFNVYYLDGDGSIENPITIGM